MLIMSAGTGSIRVSHMAPLPGSCNTRRWFERCGYCGLRTLRLLRTRLELDHGCCNAAANGNGERDRNKGNPHFAPPFAGVDDWNPYPNAEVRWLVPDVPGRR